MAIDFTNLMSSGIGLAGIGLSLYGAEESSKLAHQQAELSKQEAQLDIQVNQEKFKQEQLTGWRMQRENLRNMQRAQAMGLARGEAQAGGGYLTSSARGGVAGQISGQGNTNFVGLNENLQIGAKVSQLNTQADYLKMQEADLKAKQADATGLMSIGAGITSAAGPLSKLFSLAL